MRKHRVALIGLGMAVTPHAKSLLDLKDRVEVAYAFSPSAARRKAFTEKFPFPLCDRLDTILNDKSIDCVEILTPPNTHLDLSANVPPPASTSCWRNRSRFRPSARSRWSRRPERPASRSASCCSIASAPPA